MTKITINGQAVTVTNGVFSASVDLNEGTNAITINATNGSNLVNSTILHLTVALPPVITIESHTDGATLYQEDTVVFGSVNHPVSQVLVNDVPALISGNTFRLGWYCSESNNSNCDYSTAPSRLALVDGPNLITVKATGTNGLVTTKVIMVNRQRLTVAAGNPGATSHVFPDVAIPAALASQVADYEIYAPLTSGPGGTFQTPFLGRIARNGSLSQNGSRFDNGFDVEAMNVHSGSGDMTVTMSYENAAGKTLYSVHALLHIDVPVSTVPPDITIGTQIQGGPNLRYKSALVAGTVSNSALSAKVNGLAATLYPPGTPQDYNTGYPPSDSIQYVTPNVPLQEGPGQLTVEATGENGLVGTKIINVNVLSNFHTLAPGELWTGYSVDTEIPTILLKTSINTITYGDVSMPNTPNFIVKAAYNYFGLSYDERYSQLYTSLTHTFGVTLASSGVVSGVYDATMRFTYPGMDLYQDIPLRLTVLESRAAPIIALYSHTDGQTVPSSPAGVTVRVTNDSAAQVTINGVPAQRTELPGVPFTDHSYTAAINLSAGSNTITVNALGLNGLSNSATYTLNLASQPPPAVTITSPSEGATINIDPISVVASASVPASDLKLYVNGVNKGSPVQSGTTNTWSGVTLPVGASQFAIYVKGYLVPVAVRNVNLVPAPAPVINVTSHTDGATVTQSPITLSGTIVNPVTSVTINGIAATLTGQNFSLGHVPLYNGMNPIPIVATGPGSNGLTTTRNFNLNFVNSIPPHNLAQPRGGWTILTHQFTVTSALYSATGTNITCTVGAGAPASLYAGNFTRQKLGSNTIAAKIQIQIDSSVPTGIYDFPLTLQFYNSSNTPIYREIANVHMTVNDDMVVIQGKTLDRTQEFILDPVLDAQVASVEEIATGVPGSTWNFYFGQTHYDSEHRWIFNYEISTASFAPLGSASYVQTFNFRDQNNAIIYTQDRTINYTVIAP
jgi:hypothetical protein